MIKSIPFPDLHQLKDEWKGGMTYVVMPHIHPDGDSIGSSVAMYHYLKSISESTWLVLNDAIPSNLKFITKGVEITSYDEFVKLGLEQLDVAVVLDCSDLTRIEDRKLIFDQAKLTVNIDHHITNLQYADVNMVDPLASSTGELIHEILAFLGYTFTMEDRGAIYTAITTDTGSFKYSNTNSRSLEIVGRFIDAGLDTSSYNTELYQNKPLSSFILMREALNNMQLGFDQKIAISHITLERLSELGIDQPETDGLVEMLRDIEGVEVSIFLREVEQDQFKISLRSKHDFDVSQLALTFGGGGHKRASGCTLTGSPLFIKTQIYEAITAMGGIK